MTYLRQELMTIKNQHLNAGFLLLTNETNIMRLHFLH